MHNDIPVILVEFCRAAAVLADISNPFGRIGIFHESPRCSRFPYADHSDNRKNASRQIYEDKILFADPLLLEPGIDLPCHFVKLSICNSLGMRVIKENGHIRILCGILL